MIKAKKQDTLYLGNLKAKRDWGFAPEYVECQWRILQQDKPDDYVIGTGSSHSIEEFLNVAGDYLNMDWKEFVKIDSRYFRPTEVDYLCADITKAKKVLNWTPKITFKDLVKIMVDADLELLGLKSPGEGKKILKKKGINWTENKLTNGI